MIIETYTSIPCDDFMREFQGRIDKSICYSRDSLDAIASFLGKVRYSKNPSGIDTRAMFQYVSSPGKVTDICMGVSRIYVNGRMIEDFPEFYNYLYSLIASKQAKIKVSR
jgi:hypothetical protein